MEWQTKIQFNSFGNEVFLAIYQPTNFFDHRCHRANNCSHLYDGRDQIVLFTNTFNQQLLDSP